MFSLTHWKHNYTLLALLIIACVFMYRGTTDGLWFIAYSFFAIARRLEFHKKFNAPLIPWKKKEESLRDFDYARAFTSIIWAGGAFKRSENDFVKDIICYTVFTIFLIHLYISVIIVFYYFDKSNLESFFLFINEKLYFTISNWPSYIRVEDGLVALGYADRVVLIKHAYIVSLMATLLIYLFSFVKFLYIPNHNEFASIMIINFMNSIKKSEEKVKTIWRILIKFILVTISYSALLYYLNP